MDNHGLKLKRQTKCIEIFLFINSTFRDFMVLPAKMLHTHIYDIDYRWKKGFQNKII